jgi:hypothetical protein
MVKFLNEANENKIRNIKEKYDKFYTLIISVLWVISTIFDLICFHCFWSDYMLELYSCFFLIFMSLYSLIPAKIPKLITNYFGLISIILGRAIVMIIFSLLFLGDKHLFHKLCAIFLFIGGVILLIMELISPETNQENKFYASNEENHNNDEKNNENSQNDSNPPTKLDEDSQPQAVENINKLNNFNDLNNNENNNKQNNEMVGDSENQMQDFNN